MTDEGVGIYIVEEIARRGLLPDNIEIDDLGTGNMNIIHAIADRDKVVLVDCAKMGEEPGTIRRFSMSDVVSKKVKSNWSAHEGDLLDLLELSKTLEQLPGQVVLFGIEPHTIDHGQELTPCLQDRFEDYISAVISEFG